MTQSAPDDKESSLHLSARDDEHGNDIWETMGSEKQVQAAIVEEPEYVQGFKLWAIMGGITLVTFLMLLDMSILSTATPEITKEFHSLSSIGWYAASYTLACATLQPLTGRIYTNFDTKWTFFGFFLLFEIGSLLCAVSVSSNMFIGSRTIAGLGASGLQNGALNILSICAPMPKRPALMGILLGGGQIGIVAGPLIGGLFTQYVSWRWCFYLNLPVGAVVAALLGFLRIPQPYDKPPALAVLRDIHHKLDLIGFALLAPWTIMLLLAIQWGGNEYPWDSSVVIGLFCGAGAMFVVWFSWNWYKKDAAMIPFGMLRHRLVWVSCLYAAFLAASLFVVSYYMPIYFQGVRGKSAAISGVYLLPSILSQLVASVVSGKLVGHFGYYLPWAAGSAVLTSVGYSLLSTLTPSTAAGNWIGYQILSGVGRGFGLQIPMVAVQNVVTPREIPTAMSLISFVQTLSGALFLSAGATILTNSLISNLEQDIPRIDTQAVLDAGANEIRDSVTVADLPGALRAYAQSIDNVFYMCIGLAVVCFVLAPWMGWVDIRKSKDNPVANG